MRHDGPPLFERLAKALITQHGIDGAIVLVNICVQNQSIREYDGETLVYWIERYVEGIAIYLRDGPNAYHVWRDREG
jgi:hypothetical protein